MPSRPIIHRFILASAAVGTIATTLVFCILRDPEQAPPSLVSPRQATVGVSAPSPSAAATATAPATGVWSAAPRDSLREKARTWLAGNSPDLPTLNLDLEPGRTVRVAVGSFRADGDDCGTFTGQVPELPGSTVVVSYVGRAEAGLVHLPAEGIAYEYRIGDDGMRRIRRLDLRQAPECAVCIPGAS